jgi:cytochrome b561
MQEGLTEPHGFDRGDISQFHYDRVQRLLHWSMAAIIVVAIAIGIYCGYQVPGTQPRKFLLDIHKSLGMTALALVAIRIGYRLFAGAPPYRKALGATVHASSKVAHGLLYALMLFMPLSGYLFSSAGGYSLPWFGLFQWPRVLPLDKGLANAGEWLHDRTAWLICGVVVLHVAAALWHRVVKKDEVFARMAAGKDG